MAVPLPNLRFSVLAGIALSAGLLALSGCTDRLDKLKTARDDSTDEPTPSNDPTDESSSTVSPGDGGNDGDATSEGGADNPCENDVQDQGETALNCGGVCQPCGVGLSCEEKTDCITELCVDRVCLAMGCTNGTMDGNESDEDCGMGCVPCDDGKTCNTDADCKSKVCGSDKQCAVPTCEDERINGTESGVDCGPGCDPCENGQTCSADEHCESGACVSMTCADPGCTDDDQNGSETDKDCGGNCPACADDLRCKVGTDCQSGICAPVTSTINRCVEATCDDTEVNGRESDLNCGGACDPCADGKKCFENSDCVSQVCTLVDGQDYSQCSVPTCEDGVRNGNESAPDCGGNDCDACGTDAPCRNDMDCESDNCDPASLLCVAATCEDERMNQGESDQDCGGPCPRCDVDQMCDDADDCVTSTCDETCRPSPAGETCSENNHCITGSCGNDGTCAVGYAGDGCYEASDCALDACVDNKCPKGYTGDPCDGDSGCHSGMCLGDTCGLGGVGATCATAADCVSNVCDGDMECAATRMTIRTQGSGSSEQYLKMQAWVQANAQDPQVTWGNLAVLYFFTPEVHGNFYCKHYGSIDAGTRSDRFFARQYADMASGKPFGDWVAIWRALPTNMTAIATNQESNLELQVYNEPNNGLSNSGDHSYQSGSSANPNVVLCVRRNGRWIHAQGTAPTGAGEVCDLVLDACPADPELPCDPLEWRD